MENKQTIQQMKKCIENLSSPEYACGLQCQIAMVTFDYLDKILKELKEIKGEFK